LMPVHVDYNLVDTRTEPNDVLAMGTGGSVKITNRVTCNAEYYYPLRGSRLNGVVNSLSFVSDIATGGHVFHLPFPNSTCMKNRTLIGQTVDKWNNGGMHFGFNISRVFTIVTPKEFR